MTARKPKPVAAVRGGSSSTALKPSNYKPKAGYKPGGVYDPAVVEANRRSRSEATRDHKPRRAVWDSAEAIKRHVPDPRTAAQGAMIRTNTHVPGVAVAREKIAELRKKKKREGRA